MAILKLKKVSFTTIRFLFLGGDLDIKKVLVSNKILVKINYNYIIGYLHNGNKDKSLTIMLPKTSAYVRSYDRQTKWM